MSKKLKHKTDLILETVMDIYNAGQQNRDIKHEIEKIKTLVSEIYSKAYGQGRSDAFNHISGNGEVEDIIKQLEVIKSLIEWDYSLDYQTVIDKAIEILKEVQNDKAD